MEVSLNAKDIDEYVRKVLLESSIGLKLKELIDKEIANSFNSWDRKYQDVVGYLIREMIAENLRQDKYMNIIRNKVIEKTTEEFVEAVMEKMVEKMRAHLEFY
jgi:hypothetical protein